MAQGFLTESITAVQYLSGGENTDVNRFNYKGYSSNI